MTEEVQTVEPITQTFDDLDRLAVGRSLKITDFGEMTKHQNRLDRILEWAKTKGATDRTEVIAELAHLRTKIGNPSIYDLSAYIALDLEHMALAQKTASTKESLKKFHLTGRNKKGQFTS